MAKMGAALTKIRSPITQKHSAGTQTSSAVTQNQSAHARKRSAVTRTNSAITRSYSAAQKTCSDGSRSRKAGVATQKNSQDIVAVGQARHCRARGIFTSGARSNFYNAESSKLLFRHMPRPNKWTRLLTHPAIHFYRQSMFCRRPVGLISPS